MEYNGIIGSSGIVIGKAYLYKKETMIIDETTVDEGDLKAELEKVEEALRLSG